MIPRDVNIQGCKVRLDPEIYNLGEMTDEEKEKGYLFVAENGFGTGPNCVGTAVFGYFVKDGERARVERYEIVSVE